MIVMLMIIVIQPVYTLHGCSTNDLWTRNLVGWAAMQLALGLYQNWLKELLSSVVDWGRLWPINSIGSHLYLVLMGNVEAFEMWCYRKSMKCPHSDHTVKQKMFESVDRKEPLVGWVREGGLIEPRKGANRALPQQYHHHHHHHHWQLIRGPLHGLSGAVQYNVKTQNWQ